MRQVIFQWTVSQRAVQTEGGEPADARTRAMRRFKDAVQLSKLELVAKKVRRALRKGIAADYLVADSWFGNKSTMSLSIDCGLTGLLRMKSGKLKIRVQCADGNAVMLTANELCQRQVHGRWAKSAIAPGGKWQTYEVIVVVNLAQSKT